MVSLWPWKKDDSSPASFEKTLSTLATKITNTQASLERTRASSRRVRVLSTLYLSFAYLVYAIVALLVIGWKSMGAYEWTGMAGGPILIYLVRTISSAIYDVRIESLATRLKDQQAERTKTIQKLKDATRYDSTLELLEKYGGGEAKPKSKKKITDDAAGDGSKKSPGRQQRQNAGTPNRTTMPPPPTANIQRQNLSPSNQGTPQQLGTGPYNTPQQQRQHIPSPNQQRMDATAEFSPNAYDAARPAPPFAPGQYEPAGPQNHWYDRIMDLLLGEDETAPKNRIVLVCKHCRLVNGQAPPGTTSLSELGIWKCMACGAMNGELDEGKRLVKEVLGQQVQEKHGDSTDGGVEDGESSDMVEVQSVEAKTEDEEEGASVASANDGEQEEKEEETPVVKKRRGKGKQ